MSTRSTQPRRTTTYMGATEKRAVDELVALGANVRVAFDARTTKLHAKAWLLERDSGLSTAFVGSSNLSHTALFDGLEWNVRLSSIDAGHVIDRGADDGARGPAVYVPRACELRRSPR
jgi:HKD family nuclease